MYISCRNTKSNPILQIILFSTVLYTLLLSAQYFHAIFQSTSVVFIIQLHPEIPNLHHVQLQFPVTKVVSYSRYKYKAVFSVIETNIQIYNKAYNSIKISPGKLEGGSC